MGDTTPKRRGVLAREAGSSTARRELAGSSSPGKQVRLSSPAGGTV